MRVGEYCPEPADRVQYHPILIRIFKNRLTDLIGSFLLWSVLGGKLDTHKRARTGAHRLSPPTVQDYETSVVIVLYYCRSFKIISEKNALFKIMHFQNSVFQMYLPTRKLSNTCCRSHLTQIRVFISILYLNLE